MGAAMVEQPVEVNHTHKSMKLLQGLGLVKVKDGFNLLGPLLEASSRCEPKAKKVSLLHCPLACVRLDSEVVV